MLSFQQIRAVGNVDIKFIFCEICTNFYSDCIIVIGLSIIIQGANPPPWNSCNKCKKKSLDSQIYCSQKRCQSQIIITPLSHAHIRPSGDLSNI